MRAYTFLMVLLSLCGCAIEQQAEAPASSSVPRNMARTTESGQRQRIDFYSALNPDCTPEGYTIVRVVTPPFMAR